MAPPHSWQTHDVVDEKLPAGQFAGDAKSQVYALDSELGNTAGPPRFSLRQRATRTSFWLTLLSGLALYLVHLFTRGHYFGSFGVGNKFVQEDIDAICPQIGPLSPDVHSALLSTLEALYETEEFRLKAFESLGGAIRVPTVAYDNLADPGKDERWEIFGELHTYLAQRFPLVHKHLRKTHVNKFALVFHWQGSDDSLKPALLTAHQDVVPVEPSTVDQWNQPPFSGYYDGEWIWGRGSCDDKPGLIGTLTAVEELLRAGFQPTRTFVLAYGIDEERGGISGATAIRDYLISTYGEYAFSILIDEGGAYNVSESVIMVSPGVAEKGKFDVRFEVSSPGGHSSVPPEHTSIGMLATVIKQLEDNPHKPHLNRSGIFYGILQCRAAHDPSLGGPLRTLITQSRTSDKALHALERVLKQTDRLYPALAGTTQAADVVSGGVKTNALPERAEVIVNHRIDIHSSVSALQARIAAVVRPVAEQFGLDFDAFGIYLGHGTPGKGLLRVTDAWGTALEPAPITPMGDSGPWQVFSGTIMGVLGASTRPGYDKKTFIAPSMSTGNTDTKHYWRLTKHIFRYGHVNSGDQYNGAHTVNEAIRAGGFLEVIRFHTWAILNIDESPLL